MGRVASKIEGLETMVKMLQKQGAELVARHHGYHPGSRRGPVFDPTELDFSPDLGARASSMVTAQPVIANRLEFGGAPQFNPAPFLDRESSSALPLPVGLRHLGG